MPILEVFMKKLNKLLAVALCGLMTFTTVGCGSGSGSGSGSGTGGGTDSPVVGEKVYTGNETEIRIGGYEAGVNLDWIRVLAREYEDMHLEDSYEEGKKGLKIITVPTEIESSTVTANDYVIYVMQNTHETARQLGQDGKALDIHDVVTGNATGSDPSGDPYNWTFTGVKNGVVTENMTIEDYIMEDYRVSMKANDGHYYGLPSYSLKESLSYDANLFREKGLYLAHPDTFTAAEAEAKESNDVAEYFECNFGRLYFTKSDGKNLVDGAKLHWGNDGVEGTEDDGLPTTLEEFFVMCEFMKQIKNVDPLTAYKGPKRAEMLTNIWCSTSDYDTFSSRFTFKGTIEVVTGFDKTQPALKGLDPTEFPKPVTTRVTLDKYNGHLYSQAPGYYYGMLFMRVAEDSSMKVNETDTKKSWYSWLSPKAGAGAGHITTQRNFIMSPVEGNGKTTAMLVEGDYWYNELKKDGNGQHLKQYDRTIGTKLNRPLDIRWMTLPTGIQGNAVDGTSIPLNENGIPNVHIENCKQGASVIINKRYADRPAVFVNMLKDLMFHFYKGESLSFYSGQQGVYHAGMDYPVNAEDAANLSSFQKSSFDAYARSKKYAPVVQTNYDPNMGTRSFNTEGGIAGYENQYEDYTFGKLQTIFEAIGRTHKDSWIVVN